MNIIRYCYTCTFRVSKHEEH